MTAPIHRIVRDGRGVPHVDEPGVGLRPATEDEVAAAARAAVEATRARGPQPRPQKPAPRPNFRWVHVPPSRYSHRPYDRRDGYSYRVSTWDDPPATRVPAGRYAVEVDGFLRFFHVDGRGAVRAQHSDELFKLPTAEQERAAVAIAADVHAALVRYGREIEECGVCGRKLTNAESREAGIGPVCGGRHTPTAPDDTEGMA